MIRKVLTKCGVFFEMIKFEHSIFALPFAYLGLILAEGGWPRTRIFWLVTAAMVSFRTMGMALNRLIDCEIDRRNPRTKNRALPAGLLSPNFVWGAAVVSFLIFESVCAALNPLCLSLSPVAAAVALLYPFTKRFTWLSHIVLGIILGMAPYGAWIASQGSFSWVPALVMLGVIAWVAGFDMIYALQDYDFDRGEGLYSIPACFGCKNAVDITRVLHVVTLILWAAAGWLAGLGPVFALGMAVVAGFLVREHLLIRSHGLQKLNEAFFMMNAWVSVLVFAAAALDLAWGRMFS